MLKMEAVRMETVRGESGLGCKLIGEADWRREVSLDQLLAVDPPSSPHHPPQRQVKKKNKKKQPEYPAREDTASACEDRSQVDSSFS